MQRSIWLTAVVVFSVGCHGGPGRHGRMKLPTDCAPADCPPADCAPAARRPAGPPKVEVQRCDDEVYRVAPQKVVVDLPPCPPQTCQTPANCAPSRSTTAAPHSTPAAPQTAATPFAAQPFAAPGMVGTPMNTTFGLTANGAQVMSARPARTRMAFSPTTIRIPFPWLKAVPVEEPEELTFRVTNRSHVHSSGGSFNAFTTGPVMPAGFPMGAMPMGAVPMGAMPMGAMPMGAVPQVQAQGATLVCPPCPPSISPERVQEFTRRIQELEGQVRAAQAAQAAGAAQGTPAGPMAPMAPTMP